MAKSDKKLKSKKVQPAPLPKEPRNQKSFPIVGIGASAGGLEAFTKLLEGLPANTGMAFVFIQHLAPGQESMLTDILARSTNMVVHKVQNDMPVEPDNVYVIPPDVSMTISDKVLKLERETSRMHRPVDQFLISLAQDYKNLAIGVILSGTGSDGTEGLKAIYSEGGITFAQDEDSAKYPGMPHSAVASESVHFVLTPEKIAEQLVKIGKHPYLNHAQLRITKPKMEEEDAYKNILALLKLAFNVNFSAYKESTLNRRISRRMVIHQIDKIEDYARVLRNDRVELQALFDDLLIGVTSFFREPETFEVLTERVYPLILKDRLPETTIRIWVPGCATGEEVYSLALSLREYMEKMSSSMPIQIFGTDISDKNIEKARAGVYPDTISESISDKRLKHFFTRIDQKYQINKSIRDMCVFAKQDLTRDPPFSNLDLVSCRNVLIYLKPEAQKRVIPLFHYSLKPTGFLVLGKSESVGGFEDLFSPLDKTSIYAKKTGLVRIPMEIELGEAFGGRQVAKKVRPSTKPIDFIQKEIERVFMSKFSPPGVVVNADFEVLLFHGNTSEFLLHGPGEASLDIMKLLREELRLELQTAMYLAKKQKTSIKREDVQFKHNGSYSQVDLEVIPIESDQTKQKYFLILFEKTSPLTKEKVKLPKEDARGPMIEELKRELASSKETLQTIIEEQEATNEELRAALEEVQSSNEELQSTNEELETAKEELQSTNEELNTVNEELSRRHKELGRAHDDLSNLFTNIDVSVILLDQSLRIRRFTPGAEKSFNLIPSDIGRPLTDISLGIDVPNFDSLLKEVAERFVSKEMEIKDKKGRWYDIRLRPYLTADKKIDGVVLTVTDITQAKIIEEDLVKNKKVLEMVVEDKTKQLQEAQRMAVIGQTAGMVGHDIRNPLQSIVAATYLLKEESKSLEKTLDKEKEKEIVESIETIEQQAEYINKIISDLQEFAKPLNPRREKANIPNLIKDVIKKGKIPDNIKVETKIDNNLTEIKTDPVCMTRILSNIVANAVQAMPNGGRLTLSGLREGNTAIISIGDTGGGIPDEIRPRIFEPLVTTKAKGQGFGLAVCKRLVEALKGEIEYKSEKGNGTKFIVKLPLEE